MNSLKIISGLLLLTLISGQATAHRAETNGIVFEYNNNWRISGKSADMLTITHIEKPGEVLLSISKISADGSLNDLWNMYREKLISFGAEIKEMPPGIVAGKSTVRFLTRIPNQPDVVVLNQLFEANGDFYLATVTAKDDDLIRYVREAEPVLKSVTLSSEIDATTTPITEESEGIGGKVTSIVKSIGGKIAGAVKTIFGKIKGIFGLSEEARSSPTPFPKTSPPVITNLPPRPTSPPTTLPITTPPKTAQATTPPAQPTLTLETLPSSTTPPTTTITLPPTTIPTTTPPPTIATSTSTTISITTTTEPRPLLEVIDQTIVDNVDDKFWLAGKVRNNGETEVRDVRVRLTLYNEMGSELQTINSIPIERIAPKETILFNTIKSDKVITAVATYEVKIITGE